MPGERGRFLIRDAAGGTYYGWSCVTWPTEPCASPSRSFVVRA